MDFSENKPIYKQIIDYCYMQIITDEWIADGRMPSIKELSVAMSVNNRTVLKASEDMQAENVIYQKRGLGYFVSPDAKANINRVKREEFFATTLPEFLREMTTAGIRPDELIQLLSNQINNI
ncbi:MAG: GntR family transcriptional regulator [Muribaculum sp.]|nr:GntR family transcriptional regulator [Muribaculum sp.]